MKKGAVKRLRKGTAAKCMRYYRMHLYSALKATMCLPYTGKWRVCCKVTLDTR